MGNVSVVVAMGYLAQFENASAVRQVVAESEATTNPTQNSFPTLVSLVEILDKPEMEEDSKNFLTVAILNKRYKGHCKEEGGT